MLNAVILAKIYFSKNFEEIKMSTNILTMLYKKKHF